MFLFKKNKKQIRAVFDWLSQVVNQEDLILVERNGKQIAYFFEFPLKFGDNPKRLKNFQDNPPTFLIRDLSCRANILDKDWHLIFSLPSLKIYENEKRLQKNLIKPLRWGLDEEEKKLALKIARKSIEVFLKEKKIPRLEDFDFFLPPIFFLKSDLDVALWTEGILRGSWVTTNKILSEGIVEATASACRDFRFKPLEANKLCNTRIEITLISDLKIPLGENLINKNEILSDKGYLVKRKEKEGWFLPEVFNVLPFKNLKEFLSRLALDKAKLEPKEIFDKKTEFFIFEVDDFIEGERQNEILSLDGPVVKIERQHERIENMAAMAADWLLKIQEPDGNFLPIINVLTGRASQIDLVRGAFTGWSLTEFGKTTGKSLYIEAGRKNFFYGKKYLLEEKVLKDANNEALALAYLGQEALSLGYWQEAEQCGNGILTKENQLKFEPILFSQIGSFLAELSRIDKNFMASTLRFGEKAQIAFTNDLHQRRLMQLAVWAELVNLYLKFFEMTGKNLYLETVHQVIDWLLSYQLNDGSFRATNDNGSKFAYTRGTAKIFEVLTAIFSVKNQQVDFAFDLPYYKSCLEKIFGWLEKMQYSLQNSFFIPRKNLDLIIGGFRHDYFNQEVWIDGASHLLLGASRVLKTV